MTTKTWAKLSLGFFRKHNEPLLCSGNENSNYFILLKKSPRISGFGLEIHREASSRGVICQFIDRRYM